MKMTNTEKTVKIEQPKKLVSFTFYHKGVEYIIEAATQTEAREAFNILITKHYGKRNS